MRRAAFLFAFILTIGCKPRTADTTSETLSSSGESSVTGVEEAFETVSLFYGTNRRVDEKTLQMDGKNYVSGEKMARLAKVFSGDRHYPFEGRDDPLTDNNYYGMVQVSIPATHRRGKQEFASANKFKITTISAWSIFGFMKMAKTSNPKSKLSPTNLRRATFLS